VDVSTAAAPAGARRGLVLLGLASAGVLCAAVGLVPLGRLFLLRWSSDYHDEIPYGGWQVDVSEGVLALLLVVLGVGCASRLRRRWASLRGRTPYLRVPVLIALLPAVALGLQLDAPLTAPVTWASNHTAAAEASHTAWVERLAELRGSPASPTDAPPAPPELAALLMRPSDLGAGWYSGQRPNPIALARTPGVRARTLLVRTHREGIGWAVADPLLSEYVEALPTATAAQAKVPVRYVPPGSRDRVRHVAGVHVLQRVTPQSHMGELASFAVGRFLFTLSCSPMPGSTFEAVVDAAVRRALGR